MSKLQDAVANYPQLTPKVITTIYEADFTPTKKYFEFMLNVIQGKRTRRYFGYDNITTTKLLNLVKKFDSLLPYIEEKDIYHSKYKTLVNLEKVLADAEEIKAEKSFIKEKHIDVIYEDNEIIMGYILTAEGSKKYGKGTKWCTTTGSFGSYNNGTLVYLISKSSEVIHAAYKKMAFFIDQSKGSASIEDQINIYNTVDSRVSLDQMVNNGWDYDLLMNLFLQYRLYVQRRQRVLRIQNSVTKTINQLKNIDLNDLLVKVEILKRETDNDFSPQIQSLVNQFNSNVEKIKTIINDGGE